MNITSSALTPKRHHKDDDKHMAFWWGKTGEILFSGWPGSRTGMYGLALVSVFSASVAVEWLDHRHHSTITADVAMPQSAGRTDHSDRTVSVSHALIHALRVCLAYVVMLAIMSFNGGVFLAAVAGRAVGFLVFRSEVFERRDLVMPPYERASSACHV